MSALAEAVAKHRERVVNEVQQALSGRQLGFDVPPVAELQRLLGGILDGLMKRVQHPDDPTLSEALRLALRGAQLKPALITAIVVRLAAAVRKAIFAEMQSRKMASMASAGVDRVIAEAFEEIRDDVTLVTGVTMLRPAVLEPVATEPRDPTMIRNIKELLGADVGDKQEASVIAVAYFEPTSGGGAQAMLAREALRARVKEALEQAGGKTALEHGSVVAASIAAGIGGSDVEEALNASIGLLRQSWRNEIAIGIARGEITVEAGRQTAYGPALTRALALAASAERGEIRCDPPLAAAAGSSYVMHPATGAPCYRLDPDQPQWLDRWEHAALVHEPELVGRQPHMEKLLGVLGTVAPGVSVIALRGRSGSGRYRLLTAGLAAAGLPPDRILYGRPHPLTPAPYWPLISIARQILKVDDGPLQASLLAARLRELAGGDDLHSTLPTLNTLFGVEAADERDAIDELEPAALRAEIAKTLGLLLERLARADTTRPVVLVLRDVHDMDVPTGHALAQMLRAWRGPSRLIVALTCRTTYKAPLELTESGYGEVQVERLEDEQLLDLARSMLDQPDVPEALSVLLLKRCDGSPMLATVLIRWLVESGDLQRRGGQWEVVATLRPGDVPRRVTELLERRIAQLPANLAGMLKSAAAVGEQLPWRIVEPVWVGRGIADHDELVRSSSLLEELGFVRRRRDTSLAFAHPLVRSVAYKLASDEERRQAHQLVASAFREASPDAEQQMPMLLFYHLMKAGDLDAARQPGVRAARRAILLHDSKQGIAIATQALATCEDDAPESQLARYELLCARERIYDSRGMRKEQARDVKALMELTERLSGRERRGTVLHRAARLNLMTGNLARAKEMGEQALKLLETAEPLDLSNALRTVALIRWRARDAAGAAAALNAALAIYEKLGHRRGMGFVLHSLGMFALDTGAVDQAREAFSKALAIKDETDDLHGQAVVLDALGQVALLGGDAPGAATWFEKALTLRRRAGEITAATPTLVSLGEALLSSNPVRAEEVAREAIKNSRSKRLARTKAEAHLLLARALLRQGKHRAAARPAAVAIERAAELGAELLLLRGQLASAEVELQYQTKQRAERAAVQAEAAANAAQNLGAMRWRIEALSLVALAYLHLDVSEAARLARECLASLRGRQHPGLDQAVIKRRCEQVFLAAEKRLPGAPSS